MPRGFAEVAGTNWQNDSMDGPTFGSLTTHSTFHRAARCSADMEMYDSLKRYLLWYKTLFTKGR
jgi:hypothetical protein